jgi:hypothetical protein
MIALALAGQPLLVAWVGGVAGGPLTARVLSVLAAAAIIKAACELVGAMLTLGGRTAWSSATPIAIGSALNITLSILGAPRYGIWAIAGSIVLGNALAAVLLWERARRMLCWTAADVLRTLAAPAAAGCAAATVAWSLSSYARAGLLPSLLICICAVICGWGTLSVVLWRSTCKSSISVSNVHR